MPYINVVDQELRKRALQQPDPFQVGAEKGANLATEIFKTNMQNQADFERLQKQAELTRAIDEEKFNRQAALEGPKLEAEIANKKAETALTLDKINNPDKYRTINPFAPLNAEADYNRKLIDLNDPYKRAGKENQIVVDKVTAKQVDLKTGKSTLDSYINQLKDPKIPAKDKLRIANQSVKALNELASSSGGSDAVGAEEVQRLAADLAYYAPTTRGILEFGRNVGGYTKGLEDLKKRVESKIASNKQIVDQALGRSEQPVQQESPVVRQVKQNGIIYNITQDGQAIPVGPAQ